MIDRGFDVARSKNFLDYILGVVAAKCLELIEIAPGIDLERDVLSMMEFRPTVSPKLKNMDKEIFENGLLNLKNRTFLGK